MEELNDFIKLDYTFDLLKCTSLPIR